MVLYRSSEYQTSLKSICFSDLEKKFKVELQGGGSGGGRGHLEIPIGAF